MTHPLTFFRVSCLGLVLVVATGCSESRLLPQLYMPTPPKECEDVLNFKVDPLPAGKSNAAQLSVAMAKEGATRQKEHATSRVCAEYALRTAGTMADKPPPADSGVEAATAKPPASKGSAPVATASAPTSSARK